MESVKFTPIQTPTKGTEQDSNATVSLKRLLQKSIRCLINALPAIEISEKNGGKHVMNLANLLEQRECVERVEEVNVRLIPQFPDLKPRLLVKISSEVEKEINILKTLLLPIKELQQAMNKARADILSQRGKGVDPSMLTTGTATIPPLTAVTDSIQVAEKEARELYCSRLFYLEDVSNQSTVTSENLNDLWMEDRARIINTIKDCQEITRYFLEEKL